MQGSVRWFGHSMVVLLAMLLAGTAALGHARPAAADFQFTHLEGLREAITRNYASDGAGDRYISIEISASIARFDTVANAEAGYDEVTWQYANGFASSEPGATPAASPVTGLGDATTAYTSVTHTEMLLEWYLEHTVLVTREAELLYVVSATFQLEQEPQALETTELARSLVASMLATDAGEGESAEGADGTWSGGLWETLPRLDHEALQPYALAYSWDSQDFPELATPEDESTESSDNRLDFSSLDGIQRAVDRSYIGDLESLAAPEAIGATTYLLASAVAEFDSDDQASSSLGPVQDAFLASSAADFPMSFSEVDVDDIGDQAHAYVGSAEEDGVPFEVSYLMVQDGPYLYVIGVVGIGAQANTIDTASAIARSMIAVDAGDGDGVFDESGGSSGGLWDKFPDEGDAVVEGLTIESDGVLYPEPAEDE